MHGTFFVLQRFLPTFLFAGICSVGRVATLALAADSQQQFHLAGSCIVSSKVALSLSLKGFIDR